MEIQFNNVSKKFGALEAVSGFSMVVESKKLFALLGPSGSGKSSLLMMLSGLLAPDEGEINIGGRQASGAGRIFIQPRERGIGMVFQTLALWPHKTARKNLEFVLKGKCPREEGRRRIDELLGLTELARYAGAYPGYLSAGERQRLALARALVIKPQILLLDEPLSNLDRHLVKKFLPEIREFHRRFETTTILVTHDQTAAMSIADKVGVIHRGKLQQVGTPEEVYQRPANYFVASFIGEGALVEGEMVGQGAAKTAFGEVPCAQNPACVEGRGWALIRPENLIESRDGRIKGKIISAEFQGDRWVAGIDAGQGIILKAAFSVAPNPGDSVSFAISRPVWVVPTSVF